MNSLRWTVTNSRIRRLDTRVETVVSMDVAAIGLLAAHLGQDRNLPLIVKKMRQNLRQIILWQKLLQQEIVE